MAATKVGHLAVRSLSDRFPQLFLLRELVKRDFEARYAGSVLGFLWSFVQPLWQLLLYTFVFSGILKISPMGERSQHFATFLFAGLLPWMALHEGVSRATTAITDNGPLVKKLRFPAEILVLAVVLGALIQEGIALAVFAVVIAGTGELAVRGLPLLGVAIPLQLVFTLGLALLLAAVHVFFRDVAQLLGLIFTAWFFLTPIVYPISLVPDRFRSMIELNPLTTLVALYRGALFGGELVWVKGTGWLALAALVLLVVGIWVFRRLKPTFVDEI